MIDGLGWAEDDRRLLQPHSRPPESNSAERTRDPASVRRSISCQDHPCQSSVVGSTSRAGSSAADGLERLTAAVHALGMERHL